MKKYLVTGGAGFIGSHLVTKLIDSDNDTIIIDDLSSGFKKNIPQSNKINLIINKVQNVTHKEIEKVDGIFHLAAQVSVPVSLEKFYMSSKNNLLSMLKVFDWARNLDIPIVYASSSAIYGNLPLGNDQKDKFDIISPYAQDKLVMESYASMMFDIYNVNSLGLRLFNVYGPKQDPYNPYSGVISIFIDRMLNGRSVTINGGYQTRDFIYVLDIIDVMIKSMELLREKALCDYFNVGTGESISVNELFDIIKNISRANPKVIKKELPYGDPEQSAGTFDKINNILDIDIQSFTDLQTGLADTVNYYREIATKKIN